MRQVLHHYHPPLLAMVVDYTMILIFSSENLKSLVYLKGDGNDGEPDARQKLEFEKKAKNWLELKNYGWFGMIFENIQSDLPNEVRGQS